MTSLVHQLSKMPLSPSPPPTSSCSLPPCASFTRGLFQVGAKKRRVLQDDFGDHLTLAGSRSCVLCVAAGCERREQRGSGPVFQVAALCQAARLPPRSSSPVSPIVSCSCFLQSDLRSSLTTWALVHAKKTKPSCLATSAIRSGPWTPTSSVIFNW